MIIDIASGLLLALGSALGVIGGLGIHRFPDFYTRLHALGITDTLCAFAILAGLALQAGLSFVSVKLLLIFVFLVFTSPTASYALGNGARHYGLRAYGELEGRR